MPKLEVIVVDQRSPDGSAEAVRDSYPRALLLVDASDRGFGHANNLGLRRARGRYLLTLNPDTLLPPHALHTLVQWMDAHPTVGVVGPKLVRADGSLDLACRRTFPTPATALYRLLGLSRLFPRSRTLARYNLTYLDPDQPAEVDSVSGAFMLVRREAAEKTGFFDEDYFMYGEDLDWAYRIKCAGWSVYYLPAVEVRHYKGQASRQRSTRTTIEFYRAMLTFYRKHQATTNPWILNAFVVGGVVLRGVFAVLRNGLRSRDKRRVA